MVRMGCEFKSLDKVMVLNFLSEVYKAGNDIQNFYLSITAF